MLRPPRLLGLALALLAPGPMLPADPAAVPAQPYAWQSVRIGGGGFVTGLVFHPRERGLLYARTDVGGAYRWDAASSRWIPLTDWLGMADVNLTGIESVAVDPNDPECVYLAAGTYNRPQTGNAAMLLSSDRGRTFTRVDLPFKMGANEAGRGNGERLAVDPNDGRILLFGSRDAGLWRSADRGAAWARVEGFPAAATAPAASWGNGPWSQRVGIVWVIFDPRSGRPGEPTRTLYAGVSTRETAVFRSTDAGTTWEAVPGQPVGFRPTRAALTPAGLLYLAYGNDPGPNTMTDGAVWRLDTNTGAWADLTPLRSNGQPRTGFGYGTVTFDPHHPDTLLTSTFGRFDPGDEIFRSTDGGKTWRPILAAAEYDFTDAEWTRDHRAHWLADLKIDPFDSDHALFTTGYGIWASRNLTAADTAKSVRWWFQDAGLEETVPLGLISPPEGAHLISALGDLDGFVHDRLDVAPLQFTAPPRFANGEDLAFAAGQPAIIVRCGTVRRRTTEVRIAGSADGGATWKAFASEPPNSDGAGRVAESADGVTVVWTPKGVPAPGATGFALWLGRPMVPQHTRDRGATWEPCGGLAAGLRVLADPVKPEVFYAFDPQAGALFVSTDGASTFARRAEDLPKTPPGPGGFGGGGPSGGMLYATPGRSGDLWLASRRDGLLHSTDGGATFAKLPAVAEAYSLGFGKAAPGCASPALFLAGRTGTLLALFRSDDAGRTWVRINDDRHQFGWINHVTGDPRIFGRVYFATGGRGIFYGDPK